MCYYDAFVIITDQIISAGIDFADLAYSYIHKKSMFYCQQKYPFSDLLSLKSGSKIYDCIYCMLWSLCAPKASPKANGPSLL